MATTKTLTPTNQAITLAAFTEKPDNRTNVTNDDKLADAVNALNSNLEKRAKILETGSFSSAVEMVNYFKQLATNTEYRSQPLFKYVYITGSGEPLLFGTSSFIVLATLSSSNYGSLLCVSDNRASGGVKNICIAGSRAYIEAFTQTETEIALS